MNRLKGCMCYMAGAMDLDPLGGVEWREKITPELRTMGIGILNPCDKPTQFAKESKETRDLIVKAKQNADFDYVRKVMSEIVNYDYGMVDLARFLIAKIDTNIHACGTYCEIAIAVTHHKPVLLVCKDGIEYIPNWLFGLIPTKLMFSSFEQMFQYLHHINEDDIIDDLNRWKFFDYNKIYGINHD